MFKRLKRIVYPVSDLSKAKEWYSEILGTSPLFDAPFAAIFAVGDCSLSLTEGVLADCASGKTMEVYWEVDDVEAALKMLLNKGAILQTPITEMLNIRTAKVLDPFGNMIGITDQGAANKHKTVENKASDTAMTVTFCRALSAKDDRLKTKGPDDLAELFLNKEAKELLKNGTTRNWAIQNLVTSPLYGYFTARVAYMDSVFLRACKNNIPQIVLMGAGYDTRTIRYCNEIKNTKVFELDIPTTQNRKIECMNEAGIEKPKALTFVPINFEKEKILKVLLCAGYDPSAQTLFLWEGVMYYLTKSTVESTMRFIAEYSGKQSCLCLDCMREEMQSVNRDEPFRFWMTPKDLTEMMRGYGFTIIEAIEQEEMMRRFLTLTDGTAEKCLTAFYFLNAEKIR